MTKSGSTLPLRVRSPRIWMRELAPGSPALADTFTKQDLTIAGKVMLVLYASTDVRDTDWWVQLSDVDWCGRGEVGELEGAGLSSTGPCDGPVASRANDPGLIRLPS